MPGPIYEYPVPSPYSNARFELDYFESEIYVKLVGTWTKSGTLYVNTAFDLAAQKSILDDLITNHTGIAPPPESDRVEVINPDETQADFNEPRTADGRRIFQSNIVPPGYFFYGTGNLDSDSGRGEGVRLAGEWPSAGDYQIKGRFFEHVYIHGGFIHACGGGPFDHISLILWARAATIVETPGNVVLVPHGPGNVVIPSDSGTHTLDTTVTSMEYCPNAAPVPTPGTGFWNWDSESGIVPAPNGDGNFSIFTFDIPLVRQANKYPVIHSADVTPEAAVKGKKILPHWEWCFDIHKESDTGDPLMLAVKLDTSRLKTI